MTWEFEPYEGIDELWSTEDVEDDITFDSWLRLKRWSRQTRLKYAMKKRITQGGGPIACNASMPQPATADSFKCGDHHRSADLCNFRCIPHSCITQQLLKKKFGRVDGRSIRQK